MKRIICAIAAVSILGTNANAIEFADTKGHWAQNTIRRLSDLGIVNGIGNNLFNPDGLITRAEYLKIMMNFSGIEPVPYREGYCLDADADDWYCEYLQSALDKGLIPKEMIASYKAELETNNDSSISVRYYGAFNSDLAINREEMAVLTMHLYQYSLSAQNSSLIKPGIVSFKDSDNISVWALPSVKLAVSMGFIEGMDDGTFQPRETATRAQAATLIGRIIDSNNLRLFDEYAN